MKQMTLYPLKGFTFENHDIFFGSTRREITEILGAPDELFPPFHEIDNTFVEHRGDAEFEYNGEYLMSVCIPCTYEIVYNGISLGADFGKLLMERKPANDKCVFFAALRWGYIEEAGLIFRYSDHRCHYFIKDSSHFQRTLQGLEIMQECKLRELEKEKRENI